MAYKYTPPRSTVTRTGTVAPFANTNVQGDSSNVPLWYKEPTIQPYYQAPTWLREEKIDSLKTSVADWKASTGYVAPDTDFSKGEYIGQRFKQSVVEQTRSSISAPQAMVEVGKSLWEKITGITQAESNAAGAELTRYMDAAGYKRPSVAPVTKAIESLKTSQQKTEQKIYQMEQTGKVSKGLKFAGDIVTVPAQQVGFAIEAATGIPVGTFGVFTSYVNRELDQGGDVLAGGIKGIVSGQIEKRLFNMFKFLSPAGKTATGFLNKVLAKAVPASVAKAPLFSVVAKLAQSAAGEGIEEWVNTYTDAVTDWVITNPGKPMSSWLNMQTFKESMYSTLVGAASGALLGTTQFLGKGTYTEDQKALAQLSKDVAAIPVGDMELPENVEKIEVLNYVIARKKTDPKKPTATLMMEYLNLKNKPTETTIPKSADSIVLDETVKTVVYRDDVTGNFVVVEPSTGDVLGNAEKLNDAVTQVRSIFDDEAKHKAYVDSQTNKNVNEWATIVPETTNATVSPVDAPRSVSNVETTTIPTSTTKSVVEQARQQEAPSMQSTASNVQKFASLVDASDSITQAETIDLSKAEIISTKTSTGNIYKVGDKVYKSATFKDGNPTIESEVYNALSGVDGISEADVVTIDGKEYIETPLYPRVISIDDVPKDQRKKYERTIIDNVDRITRAVESVSNAGYVYSDPLQFGHTRDMKMNLMDFSNASKETGKLYDDNAVEDNYNRLSQFYNAFGLTRLANIVSDAIRYKGLLEINTLEEVRNKDTLLSEEDYPIVEQLKNSGGDLTPNNVYYATNGRHIGIGNIAQTEPIDGTKYIYSEKAISPKLIDEWEMTTVYEKKTTKPVIAKTSTTEPTIAKNTTVAMPKIPNEQKYASLVDSSASITEATDNFNKMYDSDPDIEAEIASRIKTPDDLYNEMYRLKRELEMKKGTESKRWNGIMNLQLLAMKSYAERVLKIKKGERLYAFMEHAVEQLNKSVDERNMTDLENELDNISYVKMSNETTVEKANSIMKIENKSRRKEILDELYGKLAMKEYKQKMNGEYTETEYVIAPHEMIALGMWAKELTVSGTDKDIEKASKIISMLSRRMTGSGQFTQAARALWEIMHPESVSKRLVNEFDKANGDINVKDRDKRTKESANIIEKHRKESAVEAIRKAIGDLANMGDINFFKQGASPADMLAARIKADVEKSDGARRTDLQKMVATLFRVYKETNTTETAKANPYDAIAEMAVNRKVYANTWDTAKSIVSETFADNPVLQEYFKRLADPTMTKSIMSKVITETFKAMGKAPNDLARSYFMTDGASMGEFLQVLKTQMPNIDDASFDYLSTHMKARFKEEMESRRVRMMEQLRKQYDADGSAKIIEVRKASTKERIIKQLEDAAFKDSFDIADVRKAWANRMGLMDIDEATKKDIYDTMKKIAVMEDDDAKADAFDEMLKRIAGKMQGDAYDKFLSLRRMSMLLNPVSWIKNMTSNLGGFPFYRTLDILKNKLNKLAGNDIPQERRIMGERWLSKGKNKTIDSTVDRWSTQRKMDALLESSSTYSVSKIMSHEKRIWKSDFVEKITRLPYNVMGKGQLTKNIRFQYLGDSGMFKTHFTDSFRNRLNAMGYNENMDTETKARIEKIAADEAVQVAILRTYRKVTMLTNAIQSLKNKQFARRDIQGALDRGNIREARKLQWEAQGINAAIDILVPFVTTPVAIAVQGYKFSPINLGLQTLNWIGYGFKKAHMKKLGISTTAEMSERLSSIHHQFAQALVGTVGQFTLGAVLALAGVLTGSPPDNDKEKREWAQQGKRPYSIYIKGLGSFSIDWFQPAALTMMMGAEFTSQMAKKDFSFSGFSIAALASVNTLVGNTIVDQIMNPFDTSAGKNEFSDKAQGFVIDAAFQLVPGVLRRAARIFDKYERDIYTGSTINVIKNRILSNIPFASMLIPAKVDIWGNKVEQKFITGGIIARTAGNMLSPFLYSADDRDPLTNEVARLYEATGLTDAIPVVPSKNLTEVKYKGVEYPGETLEGKDWETYQTILGQTQYQYATVVMQSERYQKADDAKRVEYIKKAYTEASADAKKEYIKQKYNLS